LLDKGGDIEVQAPSRISSVIFGVKMASKERATIMNILHHDQNIIYKEAVLVDGEFKLQIKDCG